MRVVAFALLISAAGLAGCDGPRENAGEVADNAAGVGAGTLGQGPAERLGELQDRAADAAKDAREAQADALDRAADAKRDAADEAAEQLEQQAEKLRGK
jgi:hypothetical protein